MGSPALREGSWACGPAGSAPGAGVGQRCHHVDPMVLPERWECRPQRAGQFSRQTLLEGICSGGDTGEPSLSVLPAGPGPSSSLAHCRRGLGSGAPLNSWTLGLGHAREPGWARGHAVLGAAPSGRQGPLGSPPRRPALPLRPSTSRWPGVLPGGPRTKAPPAAPNQRLLHGQMDGSGPLSLPSPP